MWDLVGMGHSEAPVPAESWEIGHHVVCLPVGNGHCKVNISVGPSGSRRPGVHVSVGAGGREEGIKQHR